MEHLYFGTKEKENVVWWVQIGPIPENGNVRLRRNVRKAMPPSCLQLAVQDSGGRFALFGQVFLLILYTNELNIRGSWP